ncbi:MAG: 3-hydroxybutyryl-CoA dehydrogenase [Defluviicoccus sp.]|nr:3-hydroxybutyryl-CoA dehydrogenase [Defluviicoccus sp.]MDE0382696.1 3-hydroxybutyryl-CoA dehydrogenase [Defluviicoccus sp.]
MSAAAASPGSIDAAPIRRVGVIGAGQMGSGIANVCAAHGFDVVLGDISKDQVGKALDAIAANYDRQVRRNRMTEDQKAEALARIETGSGYSLFADCDLIIEAATENEEVKREIYKRVVTEIRDDAIIASNTSSISITRLGAATDRPARFMGMHFMNPVPAMQLVELIPGIATARETFEAIEALTFALGKTPVNSEDFPAFIVNRILLPMLNEAVYTLHEGVGSVEAIDNAMRLGANHPMGPLQLADFIGLDTCLAVMQVLYEGLADTKYRPCPLLVKYVEAGWLGRKSGRGFYDYSGDTPTPTR